MLPQIHLDATDPLASRMRDRFFPGEEIVVVPKEGNLPVGDCYQNVRVTLRQRGGGAQLGWLLSLFAGHYVEATHHAVWINADGHLVDVTGPAFPPMTGPVTSFILDRVTSFNMPLEPKVASWFLQLDDHAGTKDYIKLTRERMSAGARMQSIAVAACLPILGNAEGRATGFDMRSAPEAISRELKALSGRVLEIERKRKRYFIAFNTGDFRRTN